MIPVLINLGPIPINSFGLLMVLTFAVGWQRLALSLSEAGEDPAIAERMVFWAAIGGLLGARVDYLLSFPTELFERPFAAIFGGAGFVYYGGFIGGVLAVWLVVRRAGKSFIRYADLTAPALALGYAVGRIGCQLSGDGDYGAPTQLPWGFQYSLGVVATKPGVYSHPTPVYETFGALFVAWVLLKLLRNGSFARDGQVFGIYLALSAAFRFFVEYLRIEPRVALGFTQAQLASVAIALVGLALAFGVGLPKREIADR